MQIDDKAINFIKKAKAAGATIDQVADFLRDKGYEFDYTPTNTPTQQTEQAPEQNGPGLVQGTSRAFATGATGGLAPWIAGIENIQARAAGAIGAAIADRDLSTLKQLDPRRYKEYYGEGKREYTQSQEQFAKEHPVANVLGEAAGTIAGIGLTGGTVGAGTRAAVAGTRLGQAGLPGMIAARTAGEAAGFAAYEAARGATESGELSAKGAGTGALKGGTMGVAFGVLGGGIQAAEPGLIQQAQKLIVNPTASKLLVKTLGLGAEGATIGAVPAALEGRLPTSRDILTGEAFAVGGRGVARAGEWAGARLWRFANEPTKMQVEEARAKAERVNQADIKEKETLGNLMAVGRERAALERQYGVAEESRKLKSKAKEPELTYETIENEMNPVVDESKKKWDYYYGKLLEDLERGKSSGYSVYKDEDTSGFFRGLADDYEDAVRQHNEHIKLLKEDRLKKLGRVKTQAAKDKIEKEFNRRVSDADKMLENSKKYVLDQVKELEQELYGGEDFVGKTLNDNRYVTLSNGVRINLEQYNNLDELLNEFPKSEAREIFNKIINDERVLQLADKSIPITDKISKMKKEGQSFWDALKENPKEYNEFAKIAKDQDRLQLEIAKEILRNKQQPTRPISRVVQEQPATKIEEEMPLDTSLISEAKKTEKLAVEKLNRAEQELEDVLSGTKKDLETNVQVSATEKEIADYMKSHSKNPYMTEEITARMKDYSSNPNMTREQAKLIMQGERVTAAARTRLDPNAGLPLRERFLRGAKSLTSKVIQQFNWARPIQEAELAVGAARGQKVEAADSAVERINKLRSGGEQEALINPVLKEVERIDKQYPGSDSGARELLLAEKEVQFAKLEGREPSQRSVDVIEAFKDNKPVQDIAKQVRDMNQKVLDKLYESGRIDKTTYDTWKANDKYVPSWSEKELGEMGEQGIANNAGSFYRRYGGQALAYQNPILTSMAQAKYLDQFAEMNMAKKQYLQFERLTGKARLSETLEDYKGGAIKFDKKNQIVVWENGKPQIWDVPERVANYFNPVALPPASKVESFLKGLAASPLRFYKAGTTAASLGFAERNIPRDVAGAMFGSQWGGNLSASMLGSSAKDLVNGAPILVPFNKQFGGQTLRNVEQIPWVAEDNIKRYMDMYKAANDGTKQGSVSNILARMFTTALPNAARKVANFSRGATRRGLDTLSYAGNLSEETTRLAVFKSVLQGRAKNEAEYNLWMERPELIPERWVAEAGKEAREATLNFRRQMAPWVEGANKYFMPYFKPAILGAMRGMTMLSNPDIAPRAWRYIINTGILQGLILGDIVKGKEREDLEAINNEIIDKNFILRGKNGRLFTLPLAQELAPIVKIFSGVTEKIYRNATKQQREDITREMLQAGKDLLENYAPVAGYLSTPSNFVIGGPIPKTILEESVNKDFFTGTPIESKGQLGRPAYMRQTKNTPALAVQLSKTLARHNINISPLRIRHITVGLASNVAKELYAATDAVMSAYGNGPLRARKDIEDSPYARSFAVDIMAPYNQYAKDSNEIIDAAKIGKKAIDSGDEENWSEKQRKEYEMQYDIHELIKQDIDSLQQLYKKRAEYETYLAKDAEDLKKEYADKKISKAEYLSKWRELEYQLKQVTEELALEERAYQLNIIAGAKEVKESYKRAPK